MAMISPERARELLDTASSGPWKVIDEYPDGVRRPDDSCLIHTPDCKYMGIMQLQDAHLTAAAPDLAETIAGMRWEYAVQLYLPTKSGRKWMLDPDLFAGNWTDDRYVADHTLGALTEVGYQARIVRRLVSDPEVIE